MTLGAFVSAGIRIDELSNELKKLSVSGFELEARHLERSGITATKVDVVISEQPKYHRHLNDIYGIIDASALSAKVKDTAKKMFHEVGVAEAHVHDSTLEQIHFHEVGALDSLVDIVGTAVCLEKLSIDAVYSSPVRVGRGGFVKTQHGVIPTPTPAAMEILKGYPTVMTDIEAELTTPTGAAIIKALSRGVLSSEQMIVHSIGYGAGTTELPGVPNLLRVMVGELVPRYEHDEIVSVETNIDDMNPEIHPYVVEQLLAAGAHDAFLIPILMKKGRPGILLSTLVERSKLDRILGVIFRETSTLGVRIQPVERRKISRSIKEVSTSLGIVKVKVIMRDGKETRAPEFEECKRLAWEKNIPLKDVYGILQRELE